MTDYLKANLEVRLRICWKNSGENECGKDLNLTEDEVAFYDALCENESAIKELGDETLKKIAQELVIMLRKNTSID